MHLAIEKSPHFHTDVTHQFAWYYDQAGEDLAWQFFNTVDLTLHKLSRQPDLGRVRRFRNPILSGLRSILVGSPFQKLLIFYRFNETQIIAERLLHGARDLPRRLAGPPGAE